MAKKQPSPSTKTVKKKQPSKQALKAAKEIDKKLGEFQQEGKELTYYFAAGDPWGPSADDLRDGDNLVIQRIAEVIDKHMK